MDGEQDIPRGGTFVMGLPEPPTGVNVLSTNSSYSVVLYEGLIHAYGTALDPFTYEVKPMAFTDWTIENADSDEPDVYFNVRDGMTFNDGEDVTVDDVLFTYQYMLEQQPAKFASVLGSIESVEEASNDWDLHMVMNQPVSTYAYNQLGVPVLPQHIWSDVDNYQEYTPGQMIDQGRPVGAGMATMTDFRPDTAVRVEMRPPEEYPLSDLDWIQEHDELMAGGPYIDAIEFQVLKEEATRLQNLYNGEIHSQYGGLPSKEIENARGQDLLEIIESSDTGYGFVAFNIRNKPFDDQAFRQAMGFLWDDTYWVERLNRGFVTEGDFVVPPGYAAARPENAVDGAEIGEHPATNAFQFRQQSAGVADYTGIQEFLSNGEIITGEGGTYVGQEYPGSLTGIKSSQAEPKHDYTFGEVEDPILESAGAQAEIRVDGQRVREFRDGPLTYFSYPPGVLPSLNQMDQAYVQALQRTGIPVKREVLTFNTLVADTFVQEDFDFTHLGWGDTSPFAIGSLRGLFHSSQADDHSVSEYPAGEPNDQTNDQVQLNNFTGYGLFEDAGADELINDAYTEMDVDRRNELAQEAVERVYLDMPYMVFHYDTQYWPINQNEISGYVETNSGAGSANMFWQWQNMYQG